MRRVVIVLGGVVVVGVFVNALFLIHSRPAQTPLVQPGPQGVAARTAPTPPVEQPHLPQPQESSPTPLHATRPPEPAGEVTSGASEHQAHEAIAELRSTTDQTQLLRAIEAIDALPEERHAELVQALHTRLQELQVNETHEQTQ